MNIYENTKFFDKVNSNIKYIRIFFIYKMQENTEKNLIKLLELPGLNDIVYGYNKSNITVVETTTKQNLNVKQLLRKSSDEKDYRDTWNEDSIDRVVCYGNITILEPKYLFYFSDIKIFDTKGIICLEGNAFGMFYGAKNFNSDLSKWDVSKVDNIAAMFSGCGKFNSYLSRWNVTQVSIMDSLFSNCVVFNSDLSRWDVGRVGSMRKLFHNARIFDCDLLNWDVSQVKRTDEMFHVASSFRSDLHKWDVSQVTNMNRMFSRADSFTSDITSWNFTNVKYAKQMLDNLMLFKYETELSKWNVLYRGY